MEPAKDFDYFNDLHSAICDKYEDNPPIRKILNDTTILAVKMVIEPKTRGTFIDSYQQIVAPINDQPTIYEDVRQATLLIIQAVQVYVTDTVGKIVKVTTV